MENQKIRTSASHPMRIDCVQPKGNFGAIGMSFCPGKVQADARTGCWHRDLDMDIATIKAWGASMVVSLIETHEFAELQVEALPDKVELAGMNWIHLPIQDMRPPSLKFKGPWRQYGRVIVDALASGERIFIHCKGGLGRTGTIAACLLVEFGMAHLEAIEAVRAARRSTIETVPQEFYVLCYEPVFR